MHNECSRVVCAANRFVFSAESGLHPIVVAGARHYDQVMRSIIAGLPAGVIELAIDEEQGFIDQFCNFMTRTEAWQVAERNGQILRRCGGDTTNGGTLYSENLY